MMRDEAIDTNRQYWRQFLTGDDRAFRALYDLYIDKLYRWGCCHSTDTEIVKDSIQELFVDLYTYRRKLSADVDVDAYLYTSLRRKLNRQLKEQALHEVDERFMPDEVMEDTERQTIKREENEQRLAILKKEVVGLPLRQQEVLFLRYTSELSYDAVSKIMKIPVASCRTLLSRAIRQLRRRMKENFFF